MSRHLDVCEYPRTGDLDRCICEAVILRTCFFATALIIAVQLLVLWFDNSIALGADTVHVGSDLTVIGGYWFASIAGLYYRFSTRTERRKWAAYGAIAILLGAAMTLPFEVYDRFVDPRDMGTASILVAAIFGGAGNLYVHQKLHQIPREHHDHLHSSAEWHVVIDIAASVVVGVSALARMAANATGAGLTLALYVDPMGGVLVICLMVFAAGILLRKVRSGESVL